MGKCGSEFGVRQTWVGTELCHSVEVRLPTGTLWDPRFPFLSAGRGARHGSPEAGMGTAPTPPAGWPGYPRSGPAPNAQHVGRPRPDALRPHPPRPPGGLGGLWRCRLPELLCLLRPEAAWRPRVQAPSAGQWVEGGEAGLGGAGRAGPWGEARHGCSRLGGAHGTHAGVGLAANQHVPRCVCRKKNPGAKG